VLPLMKQQQFGRIINMASTAGKHGPAWRGLRSDQGWHDCVYAVAAWRT
jgi:NAD(P)-dependent dehydrogenase (short-subunit alcohol dehydrogenase family)